MERPCRAALAARSEIAVFYGTEMPKGAYSAGVTGRFGTPVGSRSESVRHPADLPRSGSRR
jgi:hypothetical protein